MGKTLQVQIRTERLPLTRTHTKMLADIPSYDWLFFTSKNAVRYFIQLLKEEKVRLPSSIQIAAVGMVTAQVLKKYGIRVSKVPEKPTSHEMLQKMGSLKGARILFPRSEIAPKSLITDIRKRGATVSVLPLYTTLPVPLTDKVKTALLNGKYDALYFKSPSGIRGLLGQLNAREKKRVLGLKAQTIGPMTAKKAKEAGFRQVKDLSI